jgi:hypothetical protein
MSLSEIPNFSIVEGGTTHRLFQRFGKKRPEYVFYRIAAGAAALCYLPLLLLSMLEGVAWGDKVAIPFLFDFAAFTRFLVAVPILIIAESLIGPKLDEVAFHFVRSGRISEADRELYKNAVQEGIDLRDSKWAEAIVLFIAYAGSVVSMAYFAPTVSNWEWMRTEAGVHYTFASWWYALISIPIFQFLVYRWFLRMFNWARFLHRVSRLELKLLPTHPDRAGGIGFVGANQRYFGLIAFALGAVFAGVFANEIIYEHFPIDTIRIPAIAIAFLLVAFIQLPGFFFYTMLRRTKRRGVFEYGELALKYSAAFQQKWIKGERDENEQLLGSGDIQSLADLGNSYSVIQDMKVVPFPIKTSFWLAAAFLGPILPLYLTVMPLDEILETVVKLLA